MPLRSYWNAIPQGPDTPIATRAARTAMATIKPISTQQNLCSKRGFGARLSSYLLSIAASHFAWIDSPGSSLGAAINLPLVGEDSYRLITVRYS
jgi:hypothetical protein